MNHNKITKNDINLKVFFFVPAPSDSILLHFIGISRKNKQKKMFLNLFLLHGYRMHCQIFAPSSSSKLHEITSSQHFIFEMYLFIKYI